MGRASAEKDERREGATEIGRVERKKKFREIRRKKLTKLMERQSESEKKLKENERDKRRLFKRKKKCVRQCQTECTEN